MPESGPEKKPSDLARFSGAGIQMVLIIGIFVFAGRKLDNHFQTNKPWFTLGLSLFGVVISLIYMVRSFNRITKK